MGEKSVKRLNNIRFRHKIILIYVIGIFIPILLIGGLYCFSTINKIKKNNIKEIQFDISSTYDKIEQIVDEAFVLSDIIYYDTDFNEALLMQEGSIKDFVDNTNNISRIREYTIFYENIDSLEVYTYNDNLYRGTALRKVSDIHSDEVWYDEFIKMDKNYVVFSYYDDATKRSNLSAVRLLNKNKNCKDILKINISYNAIANELEYNESKGRIYLISDNDEVVIKPVSDVGDGYTDYEFFDTINTDNTILSKDMMFPQGYRLCCEYKLDYQKMIFPELMYFIVFLFLILVLALGLVFLVTDSMVKKVEGLTRHMIKMEQGQLEQIEEDNIGNDEIGVLTHGFNNAVVKIQELINDITTEKLKNAEIEKEKSKAEFIALQRQLNPHFLFNIFEILRMKAITRHDREFSSTIKNLSTVLRNLINWKEDVIPFKDEMVFIEAYIDLNRCYFDDIDISLEIDDKALKCYVPKMSVEVFVENAFRHGLEKCKGNRVFAMKAWVCDERLNISISDNGQGIDEERVNAMNRADVDALRKMSGAGMTNAMERFKLYFDTEFFVNVISTPFELTQITLQLPAKTQTYENGGKIDA